MMKRIASTVLWLAWISCGGTDGTSPGKTTTPPPPAGSFTLTVAGTGSGTGTIAGDTISCGTVCSESVSIGKSVTLTATAGAGSTFSSWTGCDSASGTTCTMSMTSDKNVSAKFEIPKNTLTVQRAGSGDGTVTGGNISCGSACSGRIVTGTSVAVTAAPAAGSILAGWTGCDTPSGATCTMTMTADKTVSATFNLTAASNVTLTVLHGGSGAGAISGGGISCGTACSETIAQGTIVSLTAAAANGSSFASWTGCDSASGASCTMSMTASKSVQANFNVIPICIPSATRCVTGNIQIQERCNAQGTAWVDQACAAWNLCAASQCRVACGFNSAPINPTACLVPIGDGVNNGTFAYWTDSKMAQPAEISGVSQTAARAPAPIISAPGEVWPYAWSIGSADEVGFQFKLNQFGGIFKEPSLAFRAKRAGLVTGNVNDFFTGVFTPAGRLGTCSQLATFGYTASSCTVFTPLNLGLNYTSGINTFLFSIAADVFGGAIDLMDVNYISLTVAP
jgi:hypothetical protein